MEQEPATKTCNICNKEKSKSEFYWIKCRNRYMNYCARCHCDKINAYRKSSSKYQKYHSGYQQGDKYKTIAKHYRQTEHGKKKHCEEQKKYRATLKEEVLAHYSEGSKTCKHCGFNDIRALSIDHVKGDGAAHRKELGNSSKVYQWLRCNDFPEGFQVLCMNCQFIKKHENKEVGSGKKINVPEEVK